MVSISLLKKKLAGLKKAHSTNLDVTLVNTFLTDEEQALVVVSYRCLRVRADKL